MVIGLLLPSLLMYAAHSKSKVFAPKNLFLALANGLVDLGHTVYVYSSSDTQTKATLLSGNDALASDSLMSVRLRNLIESERISITKQELQSEYELDLTARAFADASRKSFDVLHVFSGTYAHYFEGLSTVPTVYTLHDPIIDTKSLDHWRLQRFSHSHHIAISEYQQKIYTPVVSVVDTVHHGVDCSDYTFFSEPGDSMLFIGRLLQEKGVVDAIESCITAAVPIRVCGPDNYRKTLFYQEQLVPRISHPLVTEYGFLNKEETVAMYGSSRALLFPIHWDEAFGMVMIEAMACGTPVIGYARGSVPEIVVDGVTGFIVNETDTDIRGDFIIKKTGVAGLVEAVQRMKAMKPEEYIQMRNVCRAHVMKNFSVEKMVAGYERVYTSVVSSQ